MSQMTSVSLGTKIVGYHTTSQDNASAIKAQGFKLGEGDGFGDIWGKAVYLALDQHTVDYYADLAVSFGSTLFGGAQLTTLTVQAELYSPLRLSVGGESLSVTIRNALSDYGEQSIKAVLDCQERELMRRTPIVARELGHDGIVIEHNRFHNRLDYLRTGGNQVVVFSPNQVKVIN